MEYPRWEQRMPARIKASNQRIHLLRFRRGLRGIAIAVLAIGAPMAALCNAFQLFSNAMIVATIGSKPRFLPFWLWLRWLRFKWRYLPEKLNQGQND